MTTTIPTPEQVEAARAKVAAAKQEHDKALAASRAADEAERKARATARELSRNLWSLRDAHSRELATLHQIEARAADPWPKVTTSADEVLSIHSIGKTSLRTKSVGADASEIATTWVRDGADKPWERTYRSTMTSTTYTLQHFDEAAAKATIKALSAKGAK